MSDKQLWGAYVELEKERDMLRKEVASLRSGLQHEVDCVEACKEEIERLRRKINEQAEDIRDLLEALQVMVRDYAAAHASIGDLEMSPALLQAHRAITRATGEQP